MRTITWIIQFVFMITSFLAMVVGFFALIYAGFTIGWPFFALAVLALGALGIGLEALQTVRNDR